MGNTKGCQNTVGSEVALHKSASDLEAANYTLLLEEIGYDERCLEVYLQKLENFEVRVKQLKEQWSRKRMDGAKDAIFAFLDQYVSRLDYVYVAYLFTVTGMMVKASHYLLFFSSDP